jgi:hypothetical protein
VCGTVGEAHRPRKRRHSSRCRRTTLDRRLWRGATRLAPSLDLPSVAACSWVVTTARRGRSSRYVLRTVGAGLRQAR